MNTKQKNRIISALSDIPTYAERHAEFNRLVNKNPWVKIYVAAILLAEAIGGYLYATYKDIDMPELLDRLGFFGLLGAILLVFLPLVIIRFGKANDETEL